MIENVFPQKLLQYHEFCKISFTFVLRSAGKLIVIDVESSVKPRSLICCLGKILVFLDVRQNQGP